MSINSTTIRILEHLLRPTGYSPYYLLLMLREIKEDLFENKHTTLGQKLWSYKRGFVSSKIDMYGLTEENYTQYISDFDYYKVQPINGRFNRWIDDKLTLKYILHQFDDYLPRYYYQISASRQGIAVTRLMDCPPEFGGELEDVLGLLRREGTMAVKLIAGSLGKGFYKIQFSHKHYYINGQRQDQNEMLAFLQTLNDCVMTEYLTCHQDLGRIWGKTANSIRIVTLNKEGTNPEVLGSWIKFGTDKTGAVDNLCVGGVVAWVDSNSGYFSNGRIDLDFKWMESITHPDSKVPVQGTIPFWDDIIQTVMSICSYLPQLKIMGFDIVVTNNGFKIIEINSKPALDVHCYYERQNTNDKLKDFFADIISSKKVRQL